MNLFVSQSVTQSPPQSLTFARKIQNIRFSISVLFQTLLDFCLFFDRSVCFFWFVSVSICLCLLICHLFNSYGQYIFALLKEKKKRT